MAGQPTVTRLLNTAHEFFRRHWKRALIIRDRLRLSEEAFHLVLAGIIGAIGGLTNLAYFLITELTRSLILSSNGDLAAIAATMAAWQRLLIPMLGGLSAGLILFLGLRMMSHPGLTNLLEAVVAGDGRLALRPALLNAVSSLVSMNTGASIGREGLLIQLSSTLASKLGQLGKWPPYRLRLLVACGAAAGVAAGCNAPISGAVFAAQIVLGNFSMNLFAPLLVSSVVASVLSRTFFGSGHWFDVPPFDFTRLSQLPWFLLLGVFCGGVGALFLTALREGQRFFDRLPVPLYARLALGGLAVGAIGLVYPDVWGNGYSAADRLLRTEPEAVFVLGLFAAKFLATAVTVGSGAVGGVFTPTLFLGAAAGSLFEALLRLAGAQISLPIGCFALIGMGSTLAATTHSPLLAVIMLFELSLNYSLMPPLMLACAVSTLIGRRLHRESIYSEPLRRKGLEMDRESPHPGAATERTVADLMRQPVPPLRENTPFREMADRFLTSPNNFLPVADDRGRLLGVVALHDLKEHLNADVELSSVIASDIMQPPPVCLTPGERLSDVLPALLASELRNVPVVDSAASFRLIGTVSRAEALGLLSDAIRARSASL
jgi:CIC family chloride channel protein